MSDLPAPRATVIVPTTGDRGPLLEFSVGSVLRQTMSDIEVFVIGDGVDNSTRDAIEALCASDTRVTFIDQPKQASRGELIRHQLLTERASGRIVAYICDRDLWFSDHLHELDQLLIDHDIASTLNTTTEDFTDVAFNTTDFTDVDFSSIDFTDAKHRPTFRIARRPTMSITAARRPSQRTEHPGALSTVGHTLAAYRSLPHGWRVTPPRTATDSYMWHQFLDQPGIRATSSALPTALFLKRGHHPGLPTAERRRLLEYWTNRLTEPDGERTVRREILNTLWQRWKHLEELTARGAFEHHLEPSYLRFVRRPVGNGLRRYGLR